LELTPDVTVGILDDIFPFDEDEMVARRDALSGMTVVLSLDKQVMAAALRDVFHSPELSQALESGVGNDWAIFMTGVTGKLGTAILGQCAAQLVVLTDATAVFTRKSVSVMAGWLSGRLMKRADAFPAIVIGGGKDFDGIMEKTATEDESYGVLRQFVAALNKFGVGLSPHHGMAVIDTATVGVSGGIVSPVSGIELFFQTAKNGIRVAESAEGAHKRLIKKLMVQICGKGDAEPVSSALEIANAVLECEVNFLEGQKVLLEKARKVGSSGSSGM
jgi:hypothetical protein